MVNTALYNLQQPIRYIEKTFLQKYSKLRKSNINYLYMADLCFKVHFLVL